LLRLSKKKSEISLDVENEEKEEDQLVDDQERAFSPPWADDNDAEEDEYDDDVERDASAHLDEYFTANVDHVPTDFMGEYAYEEVEPEMKEVPLGSSGKYINAIHAACLTLSSFHSTLAITVYSRLYLADQ
jgi:hypothetical protein